MLGIYFKIIPKSELDVFNEIIDDHSNTKKIEVFKKTLHIPQGVNSEHSFFQSICYAIRFLRKIKLIAAKATRFDR